MIGNLSLKQLTLDVWLLEQLRHEPDPGLTLEELQKRWTANPLHEGTLGRSTMTRHRQMIKGFFGIIINTPDKKHYRIANPEQLHLNTLANELLASVQEYLFLDEYRDLGAAIQPPQIWEGLAYLRPIGNALRHHKKLRIRYQKFTDMEPYDAVLHPYCLKADKGRWYMLAYKEGSEHQAQTFALDRTLSLSVMQEDFTPNNQIDPEHYFDDCYGIWHDFEHFPVRVFQIACTEHVAHYLRTLPLHHSQVEIGKEQLTDHQEEKISDNKLCTVYFQFHISPSPDFISELLKWGNEIVIL